MDMGERLHELRHFDLLALSQGLRLCETEAVLLGSGEPRASLASTCHQGVFFGSYSYQFPFRGRFALPPQWGMLAYVHETVPGSWFHGHELRPGAVLTLVVQGSSEFMFQRGFRWSVVMLPMSQIRSKFMELTRHDLDIPERLTLFIPSLQRMAGQRLDAHYRRIQRYFGEREAPDRPPPLEQLGEVDAVLRDHLLAGLSATREETVRCSRGRMAHYGVVRRAEDFMREHLRQDIYIQHLCNASGASERALRYAFQDLIGISPNRYLSMMRLCMACRNLLTSDVRHRSVKSIAISCGLWDLSRFAEHYRKLFGELPSETLTRDDLLESIESSMC